MGIDFSALKHLILVKVPDGKWGVRPVTWEGEWGKDSTGEVVLTGGNVFATFDNKDMAETFIKLCRDHL